MLHRTNLFSLPHYIVKDNVIANPLQKNLKYLGSRKEHFQNHFYVQLRLTVQIYLFGFAAFQTLQLCI